MKALISVSDKAGIAEFAAGLTALGVQLIATGGTARFLQAQGLSVTEVAEQTGFPEILDGRVKTLHPKIHGGLLARRDVPEHMAALVAHGIDTIDLLVVNPTFFKPGCTLADVMEDIDIGGPALVGSAAKNWRDVAVLIEPEQYQPVLAELQANGGKLSDKTRFALAVTAFNGLAQYNVSICDYLSTIDFETQTSVAPITVIKKTALKFGLSFAIFVLSLPMTVLVDGWFGLGVFVGFLLSILYGLDLGQELRNAASRPLRVVGVLMGVPQALFGLLCIGMGLAIIIWVVYNSFIKRLPEYSGGFMTLGIGPALILFGLGLLVRSFRRDSDQVAEPNNDT